MTQPIHALYVDDDSMLLNLGQIYLERFGGFTVTTASGAVEAIHLLKDESFDVIISDYQMPRMDGIAFLKHLKAEGNSIPFILFTGRGREEVVIEALNNGADFYLQKGGEPKSQFTELSNMLHSAVSRAREIKNLLKKNEELRAAFEEISANEEELRSNLGRLATTEQALRESEEQYRTLFLSSRDAIMIISPDHRFVSANPAAIQLFACLNEQEFIAHTPSTLSPEYQPDEVIIYRKITDDDSMCHRERFPFLRMDP